MRTSATAGGFSGEGSAGFQHGGADQQRDTRLQRRTCATQRSSPAVERWQKRVRHRWSCDVLTISDLALFVPDLAISCSDLVISLPDLYPKTKITIFFLVFLKLSSISPAISPLSLSPLSLSPLSLTDRQPLSLSLSPRSLVAAIEAATRPSGLPSPSAGSSVWSVRRLSSLYLAISEALATTVLRQLEKLWIFEVLDAAECFASPQGSFPKNGNDIDSVASGKLLIAFLQYSYLDLPL
ncbi:hypothetical protein Syun_030711 [Stephania yunnanensis]|uniref:Uncharacterized protein n=1 Tax=Stephania yunnanensis TaxID=152371 RepID=A0AAP0HDS6_9MAGN